MISHVTKIVVNADIHCSARKSGYIRQFFDVPQNILMTKICLSRKAGKKSLIFLNEEDLAAFGMFFEWLRTGYSLPRMLALPY